jgi:hypothetical protein
MVPPGPDSGSPGLMSPGLSKPQILDPKFPAKVPKRKIPSERSNDSDGQRPMSDAAVG